jgi:hypothetical protein
MKTLTLLVTAIVLLSHSCMADAKCRSWSVKHQFDVINGYPKGRPSLAGEELWVVDHICALANGGLDKVLNLQYQSLSESRKKDKIENTPLGKQLFCTPENSLPYRTVFNCKK